MYKTIHWHDDAASYAESFGLSKEDCEAIMLNKSRPSLDPRSHEVGHLIVRYRAGDVVVVVGHRDKDEPVIMSVWVDTGQEVHQKRAPGGAGSKLPTSMREVRKRILEHGYKLTQQGAHMKVVDPDTGEFLMSLPITPSDHRSVPNSWQLFIRRNREHQAKKKEANARASDE